MSEYDESDIKDAKEGLAKAEQTGHETLKTILKCPGCGKTMDIPADMQEKMDGDEDISSMLPSCDCGTKMTISVTNE